MNPVLPLEARLCGSVAAHATMSCSASAVSAGPVFDRQRASKNCGFGYLAKPCAAYFFGDAIAGIILAIMLVGQAMAYAMLAGLPKRAGLYASIIPLFLYGVFGTSRTLAVGPVAIISLLTASAIHGL